MISYSEWRENKLNEVMGTMLKKISFSNGGTPIGFLNASMGIPGKGSSSKKKKKPKRKKKK